MIRIGKPYIRDNGDTIALVASVIDEARNLKTELWYAVEKEFGQYLCVELADPFLCAVYEVAMVSRQDISIDAPVSAKFLFHLRNTIQPLFLKLLPGSKIVDVIVASESDWDFHAKGVGCGCSLGVDSLASIYAQMDPALPKEYKLTHLAFFNCGQLGDYELDKVKENFIQSQKAVRRFADEIGYPLITVDTSLNEFYKYCGVTLLQSFLNRSMSCALALQKLFRHYVLASSYPADKITVSSVDQSHMEAVFVPLHSTENCEFVVGNPMMKRTDKTKYISGYPLTERYLTVCWAEQTAYEVWHNTQFLEGKAKPNCGWCDKCLRTLLTLDIFGVVENYADQFDLAKYYEHKQDYISKIFRECRKNPFYMEMVELIVSSGWTVDAKLLKKYLSSLKESKYRRALRFVGRVFRGVKNRLSSLLKWVGL